MKLGGNDRIAAYCSNLHCCGNKDTRCLTKTKPATVCRFFLSKSNKMIHLGALWFSSPMCAQICYPVSRKNPQSNFPKRKGVVSECETRKINPPANSLESFSKQQTIIQRQLVSGPLLYKAAVYHEHDMFSKRFLVTQALRNFGLNYKIFQTNSGDWSHS